MTGQVITARERAVQVALKEAADHVREEGTNTGRRVREYQAADGYKPSPDTGYAWCASFVNWCFRQAGRPLLELDLQASVGFLERAARERGWLTTRPLRGDIFCVRYEGDSWPDHTGLVIGVNPDGSLRTVEGNTSDAVLLRVRPREYTQRCTYIRVPGLVPQPLDKAKPLPGPNPKPAWFWPAVKEAIRRRRPAKGGTP